MSLPLFSNYSLMLLGGDTGSLTRSMTMGYAGRRTPDPIRGRSRSAALTLRGFLTEGFVELHREIGVVGSPAARLDLFLR